MSTLWGTRYPGDSVMVGEEGVVVIGEPDRVRTPPELGGEELIVDTIYRRECPCGQGHPAKTFTFKGSDIQVSECEDRGFLWWRKRA